MPCSAFVKDHKSQQLVRIFIAFLPVNLTLIPLCFITLNPEILRTVKKYLPTYGCSKIMEYLPYISSNHYQKLFPITLA